jgi:hypothetical protein
VGCDVRRLANLGPVFVAVFTNDLRKPSAPAVSSYLIQLAFASAGMVAPSSSMIISPGTRSLASISLS